MDMSRIKEKLRSLVLMYDDSDLDTALDNLMVEVILHKWE